MLLFNVLTFQTVRLRGYRARGADQLWYVNNLPRSALFPASWAREGSAIDTAACRIPRDPFYTISLWETSLTII